MLDIPYRIRELLNQDHCQKNIRIHFPDGERSDICNDLIVKDTVNFTESLCSRNELKLGLCESPIFECEVVGVGNVKGATIRVFCEVYCPSNIQGAIFQPDIQAYVYQIPYGYFTIDSCKRQADMVHRKIIAYGFKDLSDIRNDARFVALYNSHWYAAESLVLSEEFLSLLFGGQVGEVQTFNTNRMSSEVGTSGVYLDGYRLLNYFTVLDMPYWWSPWLDGNGAGVDYTDGNMQYMYKQIRLRMNKSFDLRRYLSDCANFYSRVNNFISTLTLSDADKDMILNACKPRLVYATPAFAYTTNEWVTDGDDMGYDRNMPTLRQGKYHGYEYTLNEIPEEFYAWEIAKRIPKTGGIYDYTVAQEAWFLYAPANGYDIHYEDTHITLNTSCDINGVFSASIFKTNYSQPDASAIKTSFRLPRLTQVTETRTKHTTSPETKTTITRTEWTIDGNQTSINFLDAFGSELELKGLFGYKDRNGVLQTINIQQQFGLVPIPTLYPGAYLWPQGPNGGILAPNDYQSCWYDDEYTKPYGLIQCNYKNADDEQVLYSLYMNGFNEGSNTDAYQVYDLSNNYMIKNNVFTQSEIVSIVNVVADNINKIKYMPVEFTGRGLPYVEAGDTFEILTRSNDSITTIVLNRTLSGEQTLTDSYKSV